MDKSPDFRELGVSVSTVDRWLGGQGRILLASIVNCHFKCDWQWFWPNYVRLSLPQYLRLGEKIQETGLLVSLTGWL